MNITITLQDGAVFKGRSTKEVVSRMRRSHWSAPNKKIEYMEQVSTRVAQMYGVQVRIDSTENFLVDLQTAGLIVERVEA